MELGLSLGEAAMADAGRELVLGLGIGVGVEVRREVGAAETGRKRYREVDAAVGGYGSSPEPTVRLTLLPMAPGLGLPWPTSESGHLEASPRGFDVNQAPSSGGYAAEQEQEDAVGTALSSSPNNSVGSFPTDFSTHGGRGGADAATGAGGADRSYSRASDEDDGGSARKKLRLSKEQSAFLEESFKEHSTLNPVGISQSPIIPSRRRRSNTTAGRRRRLALTKLKQTEVDCEHLKRCCEALTEENRRLQKELAELRALKTVHPFYMRLPATTLSMCPSCERVASNSAPATATAAAAASPAVPTTAPSSGNAAVAAPDHRPSSFAALFSSPRNFPLAAGPQAQLPSTGS
ncbi:hypothetical protein ABZP36_035338 [Zizania latifolia]